MDRATVDERLGDLEVSLSGRGVRLILAGDRVELATAPEAGALVARYVGADAVRLSPAALELVRLKTAQVHQRHPFGEIILTATGAPLPMEALADV